jgi:DnaB-like helicase C terminal domain
MTYKRTITEEVQIKDLFDAIGIADEALANHFPTYDINIKTPYGFKRINELFRTELQQSVTCYFGNNVTVKCSPNHRFMTQSGWKHVVDITRNDIIETENGVTYLKEVKYVKDEVLYDVAVEEVHCYYSNGILSHNSWGLINVGAHAVKHGLNVLHYTLELNEGYVGQRYDAVLTGIANQNLKYHLDEVANVVSKLKGNLTIKYYPTKTASCSTIRAHIEKMIMLGKKPDLVIVDYADLLRGAVSRKEMRHELESIYEDLRGIAGEYEVPMFTASQANRSALEQDVIEADKISESYSKVMIADFVLSLSRKVTDKIAGTGRWHIIKNRFGPDGLTLPAKMNMSNGQIHIYEETSVQGKDTKKDMENGESLLRKSLSQKYKEISSDSLG